MKPIFINLRDPHGERIVVNINAIAKIIPASHGGCRISFIGGEYVYVKQSYDELSDIVSGALR